MSVLNDLKMIHQRDAQDALGIAGKQTEQYKYNFGFSWQPNREITKVIVAGMGGSGLAAKAYKDFGELTVPLEVVQGYNLPGYIDENTLVICSSYSGNTEETVSAFDQAINHTSKPMVVIIASGGKLLDLAQQNSLPCLQLPSGFQPRYTFGYQYRALVELFSQTTLIGPGQVAELDRLADEALPKIQQWFADVPTEQNLAKQLAQELVGSSVVVYSSNQFVSVAYKWKISFNENAKNIAWHNAYPEFNHNEFLGWTSHPVDKPYKVINLISKSDHPQIIRRFTVSDKLLSGQKPVAETVDLIGDSLLAQMIYGVALGDFVSLYLALLNGLNPTPVELIEKLKQELARPLL